MSINIGVTGTKAGATPQQLLASFELIEAVVKEHGVKRVRVHQGLCIGFDEQITRRVKEYWPNLIICGHPPLNESRMADIADLCTYLKPPGEYLARDRDIVHHSPELIIGAPRNYKYQSHGSGTWYTLRFAAKLKREARVVFRDGSVKNATEVIPG